MSDLGNKGTCSAELEDKQTCRFSSASSSTWRHSSKKSSIMFRLKEKPLAFFKLLLPTILNKLKVLCHYRMTALAVGVELFDTFSEAKSP